jgi:hypothetical protein
MATCALLCALGVVLSWLGSLADLLDLCTPFFAALLLVPIVIEYGRRYAWSVWGATALLSLLLLPNKSPAIIYLAFGYYPILKAVLERLRPALTNFLKLILFIAVDLSIVFLSNALFGVSEAAPPYFNAVLCIGGLIVLWLIDLCLTRLITIYVIKYRSRISKWMNG